MNSVPKIKRKRKPKKSKLQKHKDNPFSGYWLRKCDSLFRRQMHEKWMHEEKHYCVIDPSGYTCSGNVECMHLIPVENYLFRFDPENTLPGCSKHHKFDRELSCHNSPIAFGIWLQQNYPEKAKYVQDHKESITRKIELPWTFKDKYFELLKGDNGHELI